MRRYETVFILRPDLGEAAQKEIITRFEGIVAGSGGSLIETDEWGFRELAYRIRGERRGCYVRLDYGGSGATMNEIERNLKLSESVMRYLSVLVDRDCNPAALRAEVETRKRRAAQTRAAAEARAASPEAQIHGTEAHGAESGTDPQVERQTAGSKPGAEDR